MNQKCYNGFVRKINIMKYLKNQDALFDEKRYKITVKFMTYCKEKYKCLLDKMKKIYYTFQDEDVKVM